MEKAKGTYGEKGDCEEKRFCPVCSYDLKNPPTIKEQLEEAFKPLSFENLAKEIKERDGILKPEENSPRDLPKKQPYCDEEGITLFTNWDSEYFIEWGGIKKAEDLLMFIHHLTEKCWINRRNIRFLIEKASFKHGFGYLAHKTPFDQLMEMEEK